jgi:hypothetical protein
MTASSQTAWPAEGQYRMQGQHRVGPIRFTELSRAKSGLITRISDCGQVCLPDEGYELVVDVIFSLVAAG